MTFKPIPEPPQKSSPTAASVTFGKQHLPQAQLMMYSGGEWEEFIYEWAHFQKSHYKNVEKYSGAGDMGIDIAAYTNSQGIQGVWDNFQCKHYDDPLTPTVALPEIGKIVYYSFLKEYTPPRQYYFVAPKNSGPKLSRLLKNPGKLRKELFDRWDELCAKAITSTAEVKLDGAFKTYAENFDYSIFATKPCLTVIEEHRNTPYFAVRFGGGLPSRPKVTAPPAMPAPEESRYISHLLEAYGDHKKVKINSSTALSTWPEIDGHFGRQREFFYYAEALRNFARDTVPQGTFEDLQDEVHSGIIDVSKMKYSDGLECVNAVTLAASSLQLTSNPLISVIKVQDRKGICHQLANEDRLKWK